MSKASEIAHDLRRRINAGEYPPGGRLPINAELMERHGVSKATVSAAISELVDEGLVVTSKRGGTRVRHRSRVLIPLSRYKSALAPSRTGGPWENATQDQGLNGTMTLVSVDRVTADAGLASMLGLSEGDDLVYRLRHAVLLPDDVVQMQHAWYPREVAEASGLDHDGKVEGGAYRALKRAGFVPKLAHETVSARPATETEAAVLGVGGRVSVLTVDRITTGADGRALEVLRAIAPADRLQLTYDALPLGD